MMPTRVELIQEIEESLPEDIWETNKTRIRYMKHDQLHGVLNIIKSLLRNFTLELKQIQETENGQNR